MNRSLVVVRATVLVLLLLVFASPAAAEFRLGVKGAFGFGGEGTYEYDTGSSSGYDDDYSGSNEVDDDFETTYGLAVFGDFIVGENFSIGPEAKFYWWITEEYDDEDFDRNILIDFNIAPKLRTVMMEGKLELYMALSAGFTISKMNEDIEDLLEEEGLEVNTGLGWNFAGMGGLNYFVTEKMGLFCEMGYFYHHVYHEVKPKQGNGSKTDQELYGGQFGLNFGIQAKL